MIAKLPFSSYRTMIFYLYTRMSKEDKRHPLPAYVYSYIQAQHPPTEVEEDQADWRFSEYV